MDFANRGNRPNTNQQPVGAGFQNEQPSGSFQPAKGKKSMKLNASKLTSIFMLVGVVVIIAALIVGLVFGVGSSASESKLIKEDKYQAVFLDSQDGQVYFGKLTIYNQDLYQLTDIYYVRVEQPIQPEGANQQQQPNISLAKLGNELHGPEDFMFIARDKVLYWENLKDDGQVVTAIKEFKANGGQTNNQNQNQNQNNSQQQTQQNSNTTNSNAAGGTQPAGSTNNNNNPAE